MPAFATPSRRAVLIGAVGATCVAAGAAVARLLPGEEPDPLAGIPDADQQVTLTRRHSQARGREVGFFTAIPAGHQAAGLPVCLVLHGASATTADFERFGLGRFLTAAVAAGVPPFALAGADGGRSYWLGEGDRDDPQRMLREEIPAWCDEAGFDSARIALYGWSMGGAGALSYLLENPDAAAVAALSPAIAVDGPIVRRADGIDGRRLGLWCGTDDALYDSAQALAQAVSTAPAVAHFSPGGHTRHYWNSVTPEAFTFIGRSLA